MYQAPLREQRFVLHELLGSEAALGPLYEDIGYTAELADNILEEAARFAQTVLDPINAGGDREGARWTPEGVITPKGFREAYQAYVEAGWAQLAIPQELGGQGMPQLLNTAFEEMMFASNMAFFLGTSLARGAAEAIAASATEEQKALFLPKLVTGEWMGTMNLTEPQAGSDLGLLRTRAVPDGDHYRLYGQKIFITYGEHDLSENIIHLVLARIDGAPEGTKGISLFLVPKFLVNADGSLGARNDLRCISIEHKMGIHASPTCVMSFGEKEGAIGYLLGPPNAGLSFMFIMMNAARLSVGAQGLAQSERACQLAREWARTRLQGRVEGKPAPVPIIEHPDVRRMLLGMKSRTEAMRVLCAYAAMELDKGTRLADEAARKSALARAELMIPIVKGWCTETGFEVTSLGVQVHGGMGYVEETGAAQPLRDVRIASIYEGTTGIQSNDLVNRKLGRDRGAAMQALVRDLLAELNALRALGPEAKAARNAATEAVTTLRDTTEALLQMYSERPQLALSVSVPYLKLCGLAISGALMARAASVAEAALANGDDGFYRAKLVTCRFYAEQVLPEALGLARIVKGGAASVADAPSELV
ncbi:MAG: acyl-CoA dehydrogenase [Pseudomonadota bacterium]|jgi:alkylation response protein AidB-like acyl-CoA dehydrogenase|nr:MAG: acyl-CoA dehydrogenase [Pseudomonadota bacterium]